MKRFSALLFDVDGTLAETEELHRRAFNTVFAEAGLPWCWDVALYRDLLRVAGGKERIRYFTSLPAAAGRNLHDNEIAGLHRAKTACYAGLVASGACALRPGVADLIAAAKARGQRLGIVTTTSRENVDALFGVALGSGWRDDFATIVCGDEVPRKKPAPDAYLKALADLGLPGEACLAIEDSGNGLASAAAAGIPVLITRSRYFHDEEFSGAWRVVEDLRALGDFDSVFD